ncbi:transglutaminaseTgpA domain-containing protein [Nocardioides solisilvae]|uniref:transglutaminase family protein n=1 Tax=Nocardioides solisilvae TaxID=1542435 RepID=UPI001EF7467F|nr:DUF3488 and transglutaminase-like domain-containing protein [Nocardioides solisilvae]
MRGSLPQGLLVSAVAALTVWAVVGTWEALSVEADFLRPLLLLGAACAATGALLRWLAAPALLVALAQVVVVGSLLLLVVTGSPLPTSSASAAFAEAVRDAVATANRYVAPVPAEAPSLSPLVLLAGAAALVLVDLVAVSLRLVGTSGLLLLALYSVPVTFVDDAVPWWSFAFVAVSFLTLLFLQQEDAVTRWGRGATGAQDDPRDRPLAGRAGPLRSSAVAIGAGTTLVAVALPALVPTLDLAIWDGPGSGGGGDGISIQNPLVDMRRDLARGADVPLLEVTTRGERPTYVKLSVLTRFNGEEWSSGDRQVPADQLADGDMPPLLGVSSDLDRSESRYEFRATGGLDSQWLPTVEHVSRIEAPGDWRYDRATMDFIAGDDDATVAGLEWTMRGVQLAYDVAALDDASSGVSQVGSDMVRLPSDLPSVVRTLAQSVAGEEPSRFRKARALQEWFRTEFSYSLAQVDAVGSSELEAFLDEGGREGYCEQFAAAMALMARVHDIPSRVAVGFLEPTEVGPGRWEFSSHDLHAWPELFFPGSGWVRFEPTPPDRARQAPGWTTGQLPTVEEAEQPSVPRASEEQVPRERREDVAPETALDADEADGGVPWRGLLGSVALLTLVVGLALAPRLVRRRRRERREERGDVESLWAELRDHCLDHGLPWPAGRSPRATADLVAGWFGTEHPEEVDDGAPTLNPGADAALRRLARVLELSRYGRPGAVPAREKSWLRDLATCRAAITAGAGPRRVRGATWWPASLFRRPVERPAPLTSAGRTGLVDHVD